MFFQFLPPVLTRCVVSAHSDTLHFCVAKTIHLFFMGSSSTQCLVLLRYMLFLPQSYKHTILKFPILKSIYIFNMKFMLGLGVLASSDKVSFIRLTNGGGGSFPDSSEWQPLSDIEPWDPLPPGPPLRLPRPHLRRLVMPRGPPG